MIELYRPIACIPSLLLQNIKLHRNITLWSLAINQQPLIMEELDFIKNYIYKKYPTGQILWNVIANKGQEDICLNELRSAGKKGSITAEEIIYF